MDKFCFTLESKFTTMLLTCLSGLVVVFYRFYSARKGGKTMQKRVYYSALEEVVFPKTANLTDVVNNLNEFFAEVYAETPSHVRVKTYVNYQGINKFVNSRQHSSLIGDVVVSTDSRVERIVFMAVHAPDEEEEAHDD